MNETEYNQAEGIRRSDLWKMEESPEKFRWCMDHPPEKSEALLFGSAAHKLILEGSDAFFAEYAVAPAVDRRTKAGREEFEAFRAANAGKETVTKDQYDKIVEMSAQIRNCPLAYKLLKAKGTTEEAFFWTDPGTGEKCKVKTDRIVTWKRRKYILDYKTCKCAATFRFNSEIWKYGYFMQAGMYSEGWKIANKKRKLPGFMFVAQEKDPPYSVNVIEVSEEVMNAGVAKFHSLLEKYHDCKALDVWNGYVQDVPNDSFVPGWMMNEMEDEE